MANERKNICVCARVSDVPRGATIPRSVLRDKCERCKTPILVSPSSNSVRDLLQLVCPPCGAQWVQEGTGDIVLTAGPQDEFERFNKEIREGDILKN